MPSSTVPPVPGPIDTDLLGVYLHDHLAGAVAGLRRMRRTAETLAATAAGSSLSQVADEVEQEKEELQSVLSDLGMEQSVVKQSAAWLGERVARLKSNGRGLQRSPMTVLLEVELLRSAVVGKLGLWQTLAEIGSEVGLDAERMAGLAAQSRQQIATVDSVHAYVRLRALRTVEIGH